MIGNNELESPAAEVPDVASIDTSTNDTTIQGVLNYLAVNTILLQTIVRDLEEIHGKLGA